MSRNTEQIKAMWERKEYDEEAQANVLRTATEGDNIFSGGTLQH